MSFAGLDLQGPNEDPVVVRCARTGRHGPSLARRKVVHSQEHLICPGSRILGHADPFILDQDFVIQDRPYGLPARVHEVVVALKTPVAIVYVDDSYVGLPLT